MSMKKVWNEVSESKRRKLLEVRGLHPSFAKVSNYDDLAKRDGGHVRRSMDELYSEWTRRKKL